MYKVETFCLIDGSRMSLVEEEDSKKVCKCDMCGFKYWWLNIDEDIRKEAQKYLQSLSEGKMIEIIKKLERQKSEFPSREDLRERADEFYEGLMTENTKNIGQLEENLRVLRSGGESILESIRTKKITCIKMTNNYII